MRTRPASRLRIVGRAGSWSHVRVLADRQEPMQAKAVHAAVEALLGEPVRWSSVKSALAVNVSGASPRFKRVGKGRYRLTGS
jgi:hypothetical protein